MFGPAMHLQAVVAARLWDYCPSPETTRSGPTSIPIYLLHNHRQLRALRAPISFFVAPHHTQCGCDPDVVLLLVVVAAVLAHVGTFWLWIATHGSRAVRAVGPHVHEARRASCFNRLAAVRNCLSPMILTVECLGFENALRIALVEPLNS